MKLKHKVLFFILLLSLNLSALEVIIAKSNINYKEKISSSKLMLSNVDKVARLCKPLTVKILNNGDFRASHFIKKNSIICQKDLLTDKKESVVFDFGPLEIEKDGKVLYQNEKYITIKKSDGKIEKIYKDGKIR